MAFRTVVCTLSVMLFMLAFSAMGSVIVKLYPAEEPQMLATITQDNMASLSPSLLVPLQQKKGKEFRLYTNIKMNWYQALSHCHSLGMDLASLDSQAEYFQLVTLIREAQLKEASFWLSGADLGMTGTYIWMSSGRPVKYFNWEVNEPNHINRSGDVEHCLQLRAKFEYKYNDESCGDPNFLVCEI